MQSVNEFALKDSFLITLDYTKIEIHVLLHNILLSRRVCVCVCVGGWLGAGGGVIWVCVWGRGVSPYTWCSTDVQPE